MFVDILSQIVLPYVHNAYTTRETMDKHDIEKIGVREFRSELPKYIYGETPVEVLRHGHRKFWV